MEHEIAQPNTKPGNAIDLEPDASVAEVKKLLGRKKPLSLAGLRSPREEHERTVVPTQSLAREAIGLEQQVRDLVDAAYGLTAEEVPLNWETAPSRMLLPAPVSRSW